MDFRDELAVYGTASITPMSARECHEKLARDYAGLVGSVSHLALVGYWSAAEHLKACQAFARAIA